MGLVFFAPQKYSVPEDWPYQKARELFKTPEVTDPSELELKWTEPKEEDLVKFMVEEKGFRCVELWLVCVCEKGGVGAVGVQREGSILN